MRRRYWLTFLCLATATGCLLRADPAPLPAPRRPAPPDTRDAALQGGFITLKIRAAPGHTGRRPVIITPIDHQDALAAAGVILVTYEVHWEQLKPLMKKPAEEPPRPTVGKWLLASTDPGTIGKGYFGFINYAAQEAVPKILDYLATLPEVDPRRIGISGTSTNGFTALIAAAHDRRLRAAAVMVTCGDFHTFLAQSNLGLEGKQPLKLNPDFDAWLRAREPIEHPERLTHAAVLLVNGDSDPTVPVECARTTAKVLRRAYTRAGAPDRFRYVELEGGSHAITPAASDEVMAWWRRWLLAPGR